jgi:predicted aspartyl protease
MFKLGLDIPPAIPVSLMVDTGADSTMLNDQIMRSLGLEATDQARLLTSGSKGVPEMCDVCDVELVIANPVQTAWRMSALAVLVRPLLNISADGMLGRDVLRTGILHYNGPLERFTLDYN